jgi:hypothetical protein
MNIYPNHFVTNITNIKYKTVLGLRKRSVIHLRSDFSLRFISYNVEVCTNLNNLRLTVEFNKAFLFLIKETQEYGQTADRYIFSLYCTAIQRSSQFDCNNDCVVRRYITYTLQVMSLNERSTTLSDSTDLGL